YPITVHIHFPDKGAIYAGDTFTIYSSYTVDNTATLSSVSPSAGASLDAIFQAQNTAHVNAKAFGDDILDLDLLPSNLKNINVDYSLFDTGNLLGSNTERNYDVGGLGILTGSVKLPQLNTSGGLDPNAPDTGTLSAHGS